MRNKQQRRIKVFVCVFLLFLHTTTSFVFPSKRTTRIKRENCDYDGCEKLLRLPQTLKRIDEKSMTRPILLEERANIDETSFRQFSGITCVSTIVTMTVAAVILIGATNPAFAIDHPIDHALMGVPIPIPDGRYFFSGGICAAASHGVTTPIDVVKTKIQADPVKFKGKGLLESAAAVVAEDGPACLLGGLGPTIIGYGIEGATKFGLYETLKPIFSTIAVAATANLSTGAIDSSIMTNPAAGFIGASVTAGAVASLLLVPLERTRIRLVTDPTYASNLFKALGRMWQEEGPRNVLLGGFPAMLSKQVPYTFCKQVSFDVFATALYIVAASFQLSAVDVRAEVSLGAAFCASILACLASHPGDVILTDTYKKNKGGIVGKKQDDFNDGIEQIPTLLSVIQKVYSEKGASGFFAGIQARFVHVGAIITSQLVLYDIVKQLLGLPATGT